MKKHIIPITSLFLFIGWFFTNEISTILVYIDLPIFLKYIGIYTGIALLCYTSLYLIIKKNDQSWIYSFSFLFYLLLFGHFRDIISSIIPILQKHGWAFIAWTILFVISILLIKNSKIHFNKLRKFLILICSILIVFALFKSFNTAPTPSLIQNQIAPHAPTNTTIDKPNMYIFLFDEFLRADRLKEWGYDNTEFQSSLNQKGVQIIPSSTSYTDLTSLCIPSLMNVSNPAFNEIQFPISNEKLYVIWNEYKKNGLQDYLRSIGYESSLYGIMPMEGLSNEYGMKYQDFLMEDLMRQNTLWGRINMQIGDKIASSGIPIISSLFFEWRQKYNRSIYKNDQLNLEGVKKYLKNPKEKNPQFLFAHFLFPHSPYVRNADGVYKSKEEILQNIPEEQQYIEQVKFTEQTILALADLVKQKDSSAIALFLGDHGYRSSKDSIFSIQPFLAIYDGHRAIPTHDSISSINLMRNILNSQFNFQLEPLPDNKRLLFLNRSTR